MATKIYQCMQKISDAIVENKDFLTDLDREIGDADHGVNMARVSFYLILIIKMKVSHNHPSDFESTFFIHYSMLPHQKRILHFYKILLITNISPKPQSSFIF